MMIGLVGTGRLTKELYAKNGFGYVLKYKFYVPDKYNRNHKKKGASG